MRNRFRSQKGLTLIELLGVLVIVGIVAAIAVPVIGGILSGSKDKADSASESILSEAAKRYLLDYEMNHQPLQADRIIVMTAQLISGGYIDAIPTSQQSPGIQYLGVCIERMPVGWFACETTATGLLFKGSAPAMTESGTFTINTGTQQWGLSLNGKKIISDAYLMSKSS